MGFVEGLAITTLDHDRGRNTKPRVLLHGDDRDVLAGILYAISGSHWQFYQCNGKARAYDVVREDGFEWLFQRIIASFQQ